MPSYQHPYPADPPRTCTSGCLASAAWLHTTFDTGQSCMCMRVAGLNACMLRQGGDTV